MKVIAAFSAPSSPRAPARASIVGVGYRASSDDLQAGLDVQTVGIHTLPHDVVSELLRLRKTWDWASNDEAMTPTAAG